MLHYGKKACWTFWALLLSALFDTLHVAKAQGGSISNRPDNKVDKAKIQMLQSYAPAQSQILPDLSTPGAGGICQVGDKIGQLCKVHPLVVSYMQEVEKDETDGDGNVLYTSISMDIWAAVSLDEGKTWKRDNLSKSAGSRDYDGRKCSVLHGGDDEGGDHRRYLEDGDGETTSFEYIVDSFKPMVVAKGNLILVAWVSKNCRGGVPGSDGESDPNNYLNLTDDSDEFQVKGHQWCHDYTGEGVDLAEVPFQCVWAARGIVASDGVTTWTKPERLTSGRRDAYQLVAVGSKTAWALTWQEDPKGLRTGEAAGPGDGMSGATVNHKTDIWYSYLATADFNSCGEDGAACVQGDGDQGDGDTKPQVSVRFSSPVRVTDNAACKIECSSEGGHTFKGGPYCPKHCVAVTNTTAAEADPLEGFCEKFGATSDEPGAPLPSCVTSEGVVLNGDTGASRPNMFLIPSGDSVLVVLAYEESKGLGIGGEKNEDGSEKEDEGKNVFFQQFLSYDKPSMISHGTMLNLPSSDENGAPLLSEDGQEFLTDNARRVRLIVQPPTNMGKQQISMVVLFRQGKGGHGKPAHIMMRRFKGGYGPENLECDQWRSPPGDSRKRVCMKGLTDLNAENIPDEGEEDDARAHRGFVRGDFLVLGYTYTSKWGRGLGTKRYDFFVRRSFDGGKKFSTFDG
jgi:hypothetical protein